MAHIPLPLVWTQRIHDVYITANVVEPTDVAVQVEPHAIRISCSSSVGDSKQYEIALDLFGPIDPQQCNHITLTRGIRLKLRKVTVGGSRPGFWPRLTKEKLKLAHITVDWDTWKDEDDLLNEDDESTQGAAFSEAMGFRMSNGTTISGGGHPDQIAALQRQYFAEQQAEREGSKQQHST